MGNLRHHNIDNTIVVFKLRFELWLKLRVRLPIVADDVVNDLHEADLHEAERGKGNVRFRQENNGTCQKE